MWPIETGARDDIVKNVSLTSCCYLLQGRCQPQNNGVDNEGVELIRGKNPGGGGCGGLGHPPNLKNSRLHQEEFFAA